MKHCRVYFNFIIRYFKKYRKLICRILFEIVTKESPVIYLYLYEYDSIKVLMHYVLISYLLWFIWRQLLTITFIRECHLAIVIVCGFLFPIFFVCSVQSFICFSSKKKKILYIDLRLLFNKVKSFVNVIWLHINRHPHPHRLLQQHTKYSLSSSPSSSLLLLLFVCCCCWFSGWHCLNRAQIPTDYIIGKPTE